MFKISKIFFETIERPMKEFKNNVKFYEKKRFKIYYRDFRLKQIVYFYFSLSI